MLQDAIFSHQELGKLMQELCSKVSNTPDTVYTFEPVLPGMDPRTVPGYRLCPSGAAATWRACVAFGNKQQKRMWVKAEEERLTRKIQEAADEEATWNQQILAFAT